MAQRAPRRTRRPRATGRTPAGARKSKYSFPELEAAWIAVGGNPKKAEMAAAIAMAESRGRTGAAVHSRNPAGGINRGPWQVWSGHPDSTDDLLGNARAAKRISKNGEDWSAWATFGSGAYKPFLIGDAPDKSFLEKLATGPIGDAAAGAANALKPMQAIGELAIGLTELILTPEGWRRILKVTIGGVILIWALNQLSKSMFGVAPASKAVSTASKVTGAGAVRSAVVKKTAAATGGKVAAKVGG